MSPEFKKYIKKLISMVDDDIAEVFKNPDGSIIYDHQGPLELQTIRNDRELIRAIRELTEQLKKTHN